jgi:hypothetical protein
MTFSPDGRLLIANWWQTDRNDGVALIYRISDLKVIDRIDPPGLYGANGIDRTGRRLTMTLSHTGSAGFGHPADAYVFDRVTRKLTLVSVNAAGERGKARSFTSGITPESRVVLLVSYAWNLVPGDRRTFPPATARTCSWPSCHRSRRQRRRDRTRRRHLRREEAGLRVTPDDLDRVSPLARLGGWAPRCPADARSLIVPAAGEEPTLFDVPVPEVTPGTVLVKVRAAGTMAQMIEQVYPLVLGRDAVGRGRGGGPGLRDRRRPAAGRRPRRSCSGHRDRGRHRPADPARRCRGRRLNPRAGRRSGPRRPPRRCQRTDRAGQLQPRMACWPAPRLSARAARPAASSSSGSNSPPRGTAVPSLRWVRFRPSAGGSRPGPPPTAAPSAAGSRTAPAGSTRRSARPGSPGRPR